MDGGRHVEPPETLPDAVAAADLIVEGVADTVSSDVYHLFSLSSLVIKVESAKGEVKPGIG